MNNNLEIQAAYANAYNEIVQPDRVFVATQYFRRKWVPILGPVLAWLIIALRQRCYYNRRSGEVREWCQVNQEELAKEIGIGTSTLRRLLRNELARRFILEVRQTYRYDRGLGKSVRQATRYRVLMDDPLTPEDAEQLRTRLIAGGVDPETGLDRMLAEQDDLLNLSLKTNGRSEPESDLSLKMDGRSGDLPLKMDGRSGDLPSILSTISYGAQNEQILTNNTVPDLDPVPDQQQQYAVAAVVADAPLLDQTELLTTELAPDQVLVPVCGTDKYAVVSLATVVERDLINWANQRGGLLRPAPQRSEVYYSVAHALGQGGQDADDPAAMARMDLHAHLERSLRERWEQWGAIRLEDALNRFYNPDLTRRFLSGASEDERRRIGSWVTYTRQAGQRLTNPAGFLRSKIESGEWPPSATRNAPIHLGL